MRVLHVISSIDPVAGGPAMALAGLGGAQAQEGLDVSVISTYRQGADLSQGDRLRDRGVDIRLIGPARGPLCGHPQLKPALAEMMAKADVVHIHALWEEIQHQAARMAMRLGKPYIIRPCGMLTPWSLNQGRLKKRLYMLWRMRRNLDCAAAIHFSSQISADVVAPLRLKAPSIVEPNGANLGEFEQLPPAGTFRARYPQLGDRPYVVFLGRIHPGKGLELLVPAFATVQPRETMLVIVGPDSDGFRSQVEGMAREHGIADRIIFTGLLTGADRVAALADATLFSLPSFHENFGISIVEALAAGTPVVISDHVYIHKDISGGQVGGVVPLEVGALSAELTRWLGDAELREAAARRARSFVWDRYDWRSIARRWTEHYGRIAGHSRPSGAAIGPSGIGDSPASIAGREHGQASGPRHIGQHTVGRSLPALRVLHAISALDPVAGGPAVALAGLAVAQAQAGMDVSIASTFAPDTNPFDVADELRRAGVDVRLIGPAGGLTFTHPSLCPALEEMIGQVDIVHVHSLWEDIQHQACRIARRRRVPYIVHPCGMLDPWSIRQGWLKKKLYMLWRLRRDLEGAAALHVDSRMESDQVGSHGLKARMIVEPIGTDLAEFQTLPEPGAFRRRYPQLGDRPYVVYLGRIHAFKGLELLVPAFAKAKVGDAMLVIVGPDNDHFQSQVERMVRENRIEDRVIFTGILRGPERVAALADAALFSLPSYHENFGIAVIEALAAGLPVVISDHVYIHKDISQAGVGAVVPLNVDALVAELSRWLGDERLRKDTAARARPYVWERYDWRTIARRWEGHYRQLLRGG